MQAPRQPRFPRLLAAGLAVLACAGALAEEPATWPQRLEQRDFAALTAAIAAADERRRAGELDFRAYRRMLDRLGDLPAEAAPHFDEWVAAAPGEGIPLLVRGLHLNAQGWRARGSKWARETPGDQFARMHAAFDRSVEDLEAAKAKLLRCDLCYALLIDMSKARGRGEETAALLEEALKADPRASAAPLAYLGSLEPRWGGRPGAAEEFVERFKREFPSSPARRVLEAELLVQQAETPWRDQRYGDAAILFERAIDLDPQRYLTLYRLAYSQGMLKRFDRALAAIDASLALAPRAAPESLALRGWLLAESGRAGDALPDLERAAALGDRWALREAILIYGRGHRGATPDHEKSWRVCQAALKAELAEGYACTGGHYYFGFHVQQDRPEAAKWFRIAADKGFGEAMVDLGIMLWSGDGVAKDEDAAIGYWLAAKRAGEERGEQKLRAHLSGWRYFTRVTAPGWWDALVALPARRTWDGILSLFA